MLIPGPHISQNRAVKQPITDLVIENMDLVDGLFTTYWRQGYITIHKENRGDLAYEITCIYDQ